MPKRSLPNRKLPNRKLIDQLDDAVTQLLADAEWSPLEPRIRNYCRCCTSPPSCAGFRARISRPVSNQICKGNHPWLPRLNLLLLFESSVSPRLAFRNAAKAIEFYQNAFGAKETFRFENEFGIGHAEIMIGDTVIMVANEWPEGGRYSPETTGSSAVGMALQVPDVDAFVEHAVAAGAKLQGEIRDQFYGRRDANLLDPFGYTWSVSTVKEEMSLEEMHRRFRAMMGVEKKKPAVDPVPKGYSTLTTYLVAQDADGLIDFLTKTFGAEETFRSGPGSEGGLHAEVRVGDSMLMVGGGAAGMKWRGTPMPSAFHIYVPDCDATYARALEAGGTSVDKPTDQFYGERSATVKDAAGNFWYIATRTTGNYRWEGAPTLQPYLHPLRAEPVINFLKRAFGAEDLGRHATPDGVIHHVTLKIGNAYMEMGEANGPYQPMPTMFYLYVEDCDALYKRALSAGATSISEPKDQPYGDRSGGVTDPFGNKWYIATHIKDM